MKRRLGVLVAVIGGVLLAGCASPGGPTVQYAQAKGNLLQTMSAPQHQCGEYWGAKVTSLVDALNTEFRLHQPPPTAQTQGPIRGWANSLAGEEGAAIRASLLRLHDSLSYALEIGPYPQQKPLVPAIGPTPEQKCIAIMALQLEDLIEADHFSGCHPASGVPRWTATQRGQSNTSDLTGPGDLLRAIRDALDM